MRYLDDMQLKEINGGLSISAILGGIALAIAFIASAFYGYFYPKEG